jgi:hypothetical protein
MDWQKFKTIRIKRPAIFLAALFCAIGVWLISEFLRDSYSFINWVSSDLADYSVIESIFVMIIAIATTFFGVGIPVLLSLALYKKLYANARCGDARLPVYKVLSGTLEGPAGLLILWLLCVAPLYFLIEMIAGLSVMPLITPICGILAAIFGYRIVRTTVPARQCMMIAIVVAVVLATKYADWYPSKSLLRDMLRIRTGTPVITVESIMASHKTGPAGFIENDLLMQEGHLIYMTPHTSDMVTVNIKAGKVESVVFTGD